ncbi:hypothetical protein [Rurimicrobium arvi]|uniref:DNA polymerase-3 subunit delta n=1 Tax=Rurimicrobium arvi TaxID=2049916 RepID=A0ABP8MNL5_9BACT
MRFSQIVGQQAAKEHFLNMWHHQQLPHALLIHGNEGTGVLPFALAISQFILCENRQSADACGQCPACTQASKLAHPDLNISFPSIKPEKKKENLSTYYIDDFRKFVAQSPYGTTFDWLQSTGAENKQGNISAEECRSMIEKLALKSHVENGYKILLVWRPEFLGKEGNILLKLIEEPPARTILILAAEVLEQILPTILSRVQRIKLLPLRQEEIAQALSDREQTDVHQAQRIAMMASGNFHTALQLLHHPVNDLLPATKHWFNMLFVRRGIDASKAMEEQAKEGREGIKNFLIYVEHLLQAVIRFRYTGQCRLGGEELDFIQKLAKTPLTQAAIEQMIDALNRMGFYIQRNANAKIQLQALNIEMMYAIQNKKVSSLN